MIYINANRHFGKDGQQEGDDGEIDPDSLAAKPFAKIFWHREHLHIEQTNILHRI